MTIAAIAKTVAAVTATVKQTEVVPVLRTIAPEETKGTVDGQKTGRKQILCVYFGSLIVISLWEKHIGLWWILLRSQMDKIPKRSYFLLTMDVA